MKEMKMKKGLTAGLALAAAVAFGDTVVTNSSELTGQMLDTRTGVRELSSYRAALPFVYIDSGTITVTRTNDGSTVEFVGAIDSTTNWFPSNLGFFAATNGSLSAAFRFDQLVCDFSFDDGTDEFDYQRGAEVKPAFTLREGDYTLQEGTDYTAVYSNNINLGTATLTITGIGKYTAMGTVVKTFKIVFHPYSVSDSTLAGRELDTRETGECRILNGVAELQAFAYNNVPGWPKGGDTGADAATVHMTPMIGVAGGVANWFPADVPETPATVADENTLNWTPTDGFTCYKAEMLIGGEVAETAYLNLNGADFEERATVTVAGGATMTVSVTTNDEQTLTGELTYRWYVYDPTNTWYEGFVTDAATFTPDTTHYEKAMRVLVFDDRGYAGMTETLWCSKLPVMYINVEGGATITGNRTTKPEFSAQMRMQGNTKFKKEEYLYDGPMTIHVRGNSTSDAEKKPYKIKLDSKTNLLKMGKSKHWVLLSNPYDFSLLRNKTAYDLSSEMGLTAMESQWVDVVMNGEFVGNYQLCEHIRVDEKRVDIYDWEDRADKVADEIAATNGFTKAATKDLETYLEQHLGWVTAGEFTWTNGETYVLGDYGIDTNKFDISGGYLIELDRFNDEVTTFNTGTPDKRIEVLTKANRPEYLKTNAEMLDYVKSMWSNYWAACVSPDGYYQGVHYTEMSDIDSMAAYWLTQTIMGQGDYVWSRYVYKDVGKLLVWGPAWDFDCSTGGRDYSWRFNPDGTISSRPDVRTGWGVGNYRYAADSFYQEWVDDPYFVLKAVEKMGEISDYLDDLVKTEGILDENIKYIFESGVANASRWAGNIHVPSSTYYVSPFMRFDGENGDVVWFRANLTSRIAWIRNEMRSIRAAVASLKTNNSKNPYTDSANKFEFNFMTPHVLRPVEGEGEGLTPDIMLSNASNLETRVTLKSLSSPATVNVYVNGLSNGTYAVAGNAVEFTVCSNEFTNVGGHRNMISLVAKDASGTKLATTYSLVTTVNEANAPQEISNATVVVDIAAEVPMTGEPYEPEVTITVGEDPVVTLIKDVDYTVEYLNNVNPGTATVRITGLGNPYGEGEFPRGNWVGTIERTFVITAATIASDALMNLSFDTRANPVRKPASLDEILPFAWNDDSAWPTNGTDVGNAVVSVVPVAGEGTDPAAWTNAGPVRTFVDKPGEGTNAWNRQYAKLYRASLVNDAGATTTLAYFDLTGLDLPPDPADLLRAAFGESVEITLDTAGDPTVTMTTDLTGPVAVPSEVGAFTLDVNGNTLSGTNGVNGTATTPGTDGAPALTVGDGTTLVVKDSGGTGAVIGGNGGDGSVAGQGAPAIDGAYATEGDVTITDGEDGSVIKSDHQEALEEAFDGIAEVEALLDEAGDPTNYVVTVTNSNEGTIEIPADIGLPVTLDLAGQTLAGTNGVDGTATKPGTNGGSALTVGEGTTLVVKDSEGTGSVVGGNGGNGSIPGQGGKAIDGTYTTEGDVTITDGANGAVIKSDDQQALEEAFKPNAVVTPLTDDDGNVTNYNVTVTNDITGPVIVPENVAAFIVNLDGHSITGTVGEVGSEATAGGEGTAAIVVSNAAAQVSVVGPGSITGGNGGAGNPPGEGGAAIADADGGTIAPASVTGGAKVAPGKSGYVAAAVEIVRVVTSHPWGGILNVEYVCARLRRGYAYKVSFFVTVDGEDKCWTVTLPTQDVSLESFRNTAVLRLDEKFGVGKRDPRAKIFATIEPIAVAE